MAAPSQASLRRRLQSSQEAQHRQALLVRKLQAKVLQYRTRCRELEQQVEAGGGSLPGRREATEDHSLEKALLQLEEEQQRCENLAEVNALLREQLDKASEVNSALKEDVGKLTADWMRAREELGLKESEWRRERELYDSYVRGERHRLLSLWCQVVTFRRQFLEMKTATDRDLSELKAEHMRLSGAVLVSCSRPTSGDLEKKELQDRVMELSALLVRSQKQNEEKEKPMETPDDTVEILEASRLETEHEASWSKSAKEENLSLQKLIKDITEVVLDASDSTVSMICPGSSQQAEPSTILSVLSSGGTEQAFALVQEALARRRGATRALQEELSARQDSIDSLLQQHRQQEEKCRKLQQRLEQLEEECATSSRQQQHLQSLVEALRSDCANLEKTREELQQQLDVMEQEASCLRQRNTELQLKKDSAQGKMVEQQQAMERARREQELLLKDLAALEGKHSLLQSELAVTREMLEKSQFQRSLLEQEKHELTTALEKAEQSVAELTRTQKQLSAETADLRVAAANMSSLNEALAVEKVQLNNLVLQVSRQQESASTGLEQLRQESSRQGLALAKVSEEKEVLVQEKAALELRLAAVERDRQGLSEQLAEARSVKETLECSLSEAQQHVSQLEIARSQLEMQLHTITQAKEVIQGEVKCLQRELEAERSLLRQERENTAQQLLRREQQHDDTLRLRQNDHEAEIKRLLQDLASAREGHQSELQELLERWQQEKAETEREHEKQLLDMEQKVAAVQAQQQEEQTRRENAEQEAVLEKEREKNSLLETLLQTQGELTDACQRVEQLRQQMKEQREKGQHERDRLEAVKAKLVWEMKLLQESVTASETRANTATDTSHCLEQELQTTLSVLKMKNEEVEMQWQKIQMLEKEAAEGKALQETLTHMNAVLSEREGETRLYREQVRMLEKQKEMHRTTLDQVMKDMAEKNQQVESQKDQIRELQKQQELQRTLVSKMSKELEERDQEIRSQQEQIAELEKQQEMQQVQQTLPKKDEELKYQRDRVRYLEKTLTWREQDLRRQSDLLKQLTSALRWKDDGETLKKQIQRLQKWEEEEAEKRQVVQERDGLLRRQKELTQQLEDERKAKGEELERVAALLKQTERRELEWQQKAQALTLALTKSEMASGTLREEVAVLQNMVSERDTDRFHHQAAAEGEQLSWLSEKRLLSQRLERLQGAVARLELEKTELQQLNAELRRTLEQVERERRRLKRYCRGRSLPDAC
ncbi:centrosome-associated protein CEP250-like isoform X2 [Caloenas nicobarica]|uniref:centrosome-associated protein CEP250-like isoform X2 n=1 Tax=Caloenas nicobarica TaxID=187106 RepID=UPI0032B86881